MTIFYLVRHGETAWNASARYQGQTDIPLNQRGEEQAVRLGRRLAALQPEIVYCSDLARARQTAALALPQVPVHADPRLREMDVGKLAGLGAREVKAAWQPWRVAFRKDPVRTPFPGGESFHDLQQRVLAVAAEIARRHPAGRVVVISHGGPTKVIVLATLGLPPDQRHRFAMDNCSLSLVHWRGDDRRLVLLNDTSHLGELARPVTADL